MLKAWVGQICCWAFALGRAMPLNPLLVASFAIAVLVDLAAPLVLGVFLARRLGGRWRYWWWGVLVFLLFQGVTRIPAMLYLQTRPAVVQTLQEPLWAWLFLLVAAATAGLFEEGGRWLAFRFVVPPAERHWRTALMLGAGHGGLESIAVGLLALAGLVGYLVVALLPAESFGAAAPQIEEARKQLAQMRGWEPLLGGWERLGALAIQVALAVLVLQAFVRGRRWWWYALAAHTLVDITTVAVLRLTAGPWGQQAGFLLTEGLVTVYALLALWIIRALRREPEGTALPPAAQTAAMPGPTAEQAGATEEPPTQPGPGDQAPGASDQPAPLENDNRVK
jgi:uncharacterized membrane protein YhfC